MDTLSSNTPEDNPQKRKKRSSQKITLCCAFCQKEYLVRESHALRSKTHYCSRECCNADRRGEVRQCLFCGKDMYVIPHFLETKRYCSISCTRKHEFQIRNGVIYENIRFACLNCNKAFEALSNSKRKFCSQQCTRAYRVGPNMHNYKGNAVDCTCLFCGSSFQQPEAWVKKGGGKFCSASCRSRHTVEKQGTMISSIEISLKEAFESLGENYYHQHRIGKFLVDFYLPDRNLVIEADGDYWHSLEKNKKNDLKKNQYMQEAKINLVRLKESEIRSSCDELIRIALEQHPIIKEVEIENH